MPWSISDVDKFKSGLSKKQKRKWVKIANEVLRKEKKKGNMHAEQTAIRVANSRVG